MNQLAESTSLYLRQHAGNPVDWFQWNGDALEQAKARDIPILLSIGYSACHWCHVMAHESFEDAETAKLMNELFVNIKVDREERPDLDRVYQLSHQLLTGRGGGWPLTVFLDPLDLTPFFAGTYFPPAPRHGMPPFRDVLMRIREWFDSHRQEVRGQNRKLRDAIESIQQASDAGDHDDPQSDLLDRATEAIQNQHDPVHGGFGGAPKFPQAPLLSLLGTLAGSHIAAAPVMAALLRDTLSKMAASGLRDHIDGGFFRYCVDGTWTIPHFEKMLYDNAQLLPLYAEAAAGHEDIHLRTAAEGIADWMRTSMHRPNGGFSASIDADAGGHEGGFHTWDPATVRELLSADDAELFIRAHGLDQPPNFEGKAWHLVQSRSLPELAVQSGQPQSRLAESLENARQTLAIARAERVHPDTDRKRLTAWNALCIEGLARAGAALERSDWLDLAAETLDFVRETLWVDGKLKAVHAGGKTHTDAFLDDHANLLRAIMVLLRHRWSERNLAMARKLADSLLNHFKGNDGGFWFTGKGAEAPLGRLRPLQDDATPSGNGLAALGLIDLGHLVAEPRYIDAAGSALRLATREMHSHPLPHATLLRALHAWIDPPGQVIITGSNSDTISQWRREIRGHNRVHCYAAGDHTMGLPAAFGERKAAAGALAYVCRGLRCLPPAETLQDLLGQLNESD